jgi:maltooligosyltrehalose trehalohydrolase
MTVPSLHEGGFGARLGADGVTRFGFWAPACKRVLLELDGQVAMPLEAAGGGWFAGACRVPAGTRYRFRIDGERAVPDPASRFQPEGPHGPSEVVDPNTYVWRHPGWRGRPWHETVVLELHVAACGGYDGVRAQLGRLAADGITAIELMPIADVPGARNWGYDGVLPYAPHAALGRPEALKALVDDAHGHGLMVLLDVVYNHFGPDGNYLSLYAPTFFRDDVPTPWGADI